jgi:hypothetical protein
MVAWPAGGDGYRRGCDVGEEATCLALSQRRHDQMGTMGLQLPVPAQLGFRPLSKSYSMSCSGRLLYPED